MAKKEKIAIRRDDDLVAIDDELDAALGSLEETNQRIGELLESIDAPPEGQIKPEEENSGDETDSDKGGGKSDSAE